MKEFEQWQEKYPNLFREYPRSGFELCPGWKPLVDSLCHVLENEIKRLPEEVRHDVYCVQVKEKFGKLRFYLSQETPYISGAISMAENMSGHICETCGLHGKLRGGGWILTLCDLCEEKRHKRK